MKNSCLGSLYHVTQKIPNHFLPAPTTRWLSSVSWYPSLSQQRPAIQLEHHRKNITGSKRLTRILNIILAKNGKWAPGPYHKKRQHTWKTNNIKPFKIQRYIPLSSKGDVSTNTYHIPVRETFFFLGSCWNYVPSWVHQCQFCLITSAACPCQPARTGG